MDIVIGILEEGLLYSIVSLGVYITYRILDFPDMTVDGSFPFGAALTAFLIKLGVNSVLVLFIAFIFGALIGIITGIIHIKFKIRDLLAGIIVMTGLYSINLRVAGSANLPIYQYDVIFRNNFVNNLFANIKPYSTVIILLFIVIICKFSLDYYLKTKSGYLLKAVGDNEILVVSLARNSGNVKILALALANGFVVLGGAVYCQHKSFFEISTGTGTMVIALADVIIGMKISQNFKFINITTAVIIGAIIYRALVSIALSVGFPSSDLKIITAILLFVILVINKKTKGRIIA